MHRLKLLAGTIGIFAAANAANAQTDGTFLITFDGVVTPQHPTMTVGIWATWDDPLQEHKLGAGNYDLEAGEGEFVSGTLKMGAEPPNRLGVLSGRKVIGAVIGQAHLNGHLGNIDNPILLATYEWATTDFTPRVVNFETSNTWFFGVFNIVSGEITQLYPHEFTHGRAEYVIPSPSSLALIACGGLAATRRRRTRSMNNA